MPHPTHVGDEVAFHGYDTLNAPPSSKFRISNTCRVWHEWSQNTRIKINCSNWIDEGETDKWWCGCGGFLNVGVIASTGCCANNKWWHVSLHKKSGGRQRKTSGISIQIIMCQPLQSATVYWLPHRNKYSIYNSSRGLCALGLSIRGNIVSSCLHSHWWHNFLSNVTLNLQRGGSRYLPTIRL